MDALEARVDATYAALGRRRPSLRWAKAELFVGFGALAVGIEMGEGSIVWRVTAGLLIALGAYLAAAGHRTHVYDAMTRQTAVRGGDGSVR